MATITHRTRSEMEQADHLGQAVAYIVLGFFLVAHGVAHTPAFFVQWRLSQPERTVYTTTLLDGRLEVGDAGTRIEGLLWLVAALGFVVTGLRLAWRKRLEPMLLTAITIFSLVLCVLGLPQAWVGAMIDLAILVVLGSILGMRSWETLDREGI